MSQTMPRKPASGEITRLLRAIADMGETHATNPALAPEQRETAAHEAALLRTAAERIEGGPTPQDGDTFALVAHWRPIAAAPRDGTRILAVLPCASQVVVHWVALDQAEGWYLYHRADRGWRLGSDSQPTHWQALGPGPEA